MTSRSALRGRPLRPTVHWCTCSSSAARLTSQVSVARSSTIGNVRVSPCLDDAAREPVVGTVTVCTHDGVPAGVFFSKKLMSSTPCGQRIRVTARSCEVRQHRRRDLRVVAEHLALGGAGARVEHLREVADLEGPALDVDHDLCLLELLAGGSSAHRDHRVRGPCRACPSASAGTARGTLTQPAVAPAPLTCRKIPAPRCRTWPRVEVDDDGQLVLRGGSRAAARCCPGGSSAATSGSRPGACCGSGCSSRDALSCTQ